MPSNHLILCRPLLLLPSIFPSISVFSNESALHVRWPKYWSLSFNINPSNECSGLISFRMDWWDLLAVQGTLKNLLQHHGSKASILQCQAFFRVQLSQQYMTTGKTTALTRQTFIGKVVSLLFSMLSRWVITLLPRSKCLSISWLQSPTAVILEPKKIKSATVSTVSPSICHEVMGLDAMILVFWMLSFKLWKALKEMGIPGHLTCLLRGLYAGQEATARTLCGTTDWFKIEKGVWQGCLLSLCLFNVYAEYIMRNARPDELQVGIKIGRRNINNLRYADNTTLMSESEEELKSLLLRVKEESERTSLKLNTNKTKIMASCPITSRQIEGGKAEVVAVSLFLGSEITADGDCSHEIRRRLLLGKKARMNLDSMLKHRDITLTTI